VKLFAYPILVLDTETSGLPQHPGARPIEVAAVVVGTDGAILEEYSSLVRSHEEPEPPFHAHFALNLTGIRWEEVLAAPTVDQVLADLEALAGRHCTRWVAAYNRDFDREMMRRIGWGGDWKWCSDIMLKAMLPWMAEAKVLAHSDPYHWQHNPDLPFLFPPLCPNGKGKMSVAEFFGVEVVGIAHRALSDARVAARVIVEIQRRCVARVGA
jgi:DNA polymerase III epsilon subunit-like protein